MPVIDNTERKRKAAAILGSFGGQSRSPAKIAAARKNGAQSKGRPRTRPRKGETSQN
jgi:hypothetical protein